MMRALALRFPLKGLAAVALCATLLPSGHAALFEDDEARRAILEMRQRVDGLQGSQQRMAEEVRRLGEENSQLRRSLLDLQTQIETLRVDQAKLRGQNEQLLRDAADLQRRQKDIAQGVEMGRPSLLLVHPACLRGCFAPRFRPMTVFYRACPEAACAPRYKLCSS